MTSSLQFPTVQRALNDLQARVGRLERRQRPETTTSASGASDIMFSYAGTLTVSESPPALARQRGTIGELAVALGTAGGTSTVIDILVEGVVEATVTVPSSTEVYVPGVAVQVDAGERVSLAITTAGTGAADMTAEARFT